MGDFLKVVKEIAENPNVLRVVAGIGMGWIAKDIFDKNDADNGCNNHDNKRLNDGK